MYKLRLYINSDKDFYYENTLNPDKKETTELYYENRTDLTKELIAFYEHFAKTISSKDYLKDSIDVTVRYFEKYIKQIVKKIETFYVDMDFGNQNIVIDASQCKMLKEDGHIRIKEIENPNFLDFDYLHSIESIEENYNWEELEKLDDFWAITNNTED